MLKKSVQVKNAKALILGITFKENCPDIRNTRAIDIYHELTDYGMDVDVYDPWASDVEVKFEYEINILNKFPEGNGYNAIILAVAHNEFLEIDLKKYKDRGTIIFDVKGILEKNMVHSRL